MAKKGKTTEQQESAVVPIVAPVEEKPKKPHISLTDFIDRMTPSLFKLIRALNGQPPTDERYPLLIDVEDIRERTRLDSPALFAHAYMRLVARSGGPYEIFDKMADLEDHYFISLDGESRKEAILMNKARQSTELQPVMIPPVDTSGMNQPKKKHWWNRNKNVEETS